jgi:glycosyltransferase involved in cell wall biosynthesis
MEHYLKPASMKIGIEAQRIFREKKHGMDFVALELIKNLPSNENHEYFVFVNAKNAEIDHNIFKQVTVVNTSLPYPIWEQLWLPKQAKKFNLDVLHCTANTFPILNSVPTLLTLHDIIFMESNPLTNSDYSWYQRLGNYYRRLLVKNHLGKVNKIVTVSEYELNTMKKGLHTEGLDGKISRIYNGVGEHFNAKELSQEHQVSLIEKYNLPKDFILFLGNTDPKKNTPNTLMAFAKFAKANQGAHLVIGDLDQSYIDKCLPAETSAQVKNRIISVGYIDNQDLPGLLKLSQFFLYTSLRESFGIPLVEGMRCGTPVITSNTSSMPEIAKEAALLVDPLNVEDIANSSERLWNDKTLRAEFKKKGIARSAQFNWSTMSIEYSRIYSQVA